jgi:hypothetical protein
LWSAFGLSEKLPSRHRLPNALHKFPEQALLANPKAMQRWRSVLPADTLQFCDRVKALCETEVKAARPRVPKKNGGRRGEYDDLVDFAYQCLQNNPTQPWRDVYQACLDRFGMRKMPSDGDREAFPHYIRRRFITREMTNPKQ